MRAALMLTAVLTGAASGADPAARITAAIDRHLAADWQARKITPAPPADDAEFLRRVHLDLIGRIPRVSEARDFLADTDPAKRAKLVERLLNTSVHAAHFAAVTRADWLPNTLSDIQVQFFGMQFERWLQEQIRENVPLDKLARDLITAKVNLGRGRFRFGGREENFGEGLNGFYAANESKPENVAAAVSRVFLGVKLECAQCHDHPFAPYTRDQFWEFAAFFGEFTPLPPVGPSFVGPLQPQFELSQIGIPNTERTVAARYLNGESPDWSRDRTPRQELAAWLTSNENPYFARNLANRVWAHLFGVGLIDPVDEPGDENPPSHPELLADLAAGFAAAGFDQRTLIRGIVASRAYQLTSRQTDPTQADLRRLARMNVKGLTADQVYDSFLVATGQRDLTPGRDSFFDPRAEGGRAVFRTVFARASAKPTELQASILQALTLMNDRQVADQTSFDRSETLAAIADAPFLDTDGKLEALFLAAFTRPPTPAERERFASHVDAGGPSGDKRKSAGRRVLGAAEQPRVYRQPLISVGRPSRLCGRRPAEVASAPCPAGRRRRAGLTRPTPSHPERSDVHHR
ncbi:MAG: DUF1549 and DUF1553 domain-containing protein [Gemmataceae bacterium]